MDSNQPDIDKILNSLNHVERASPGPFFFSKLENRLAHKQQLVAQSKQEQWLGWVVNHQYMVAAGIILLLLLNILILSNFNAGEIINYNDSTASLVEDYSLNDYAWYSYNE